jgi:hypothetical protein
MNDILPSKDLIFGGFYIKFPYTQKESIVSILKWWSAILVVLAGIGQSLNKTNNSIPLLLCAIWILIFEWRVDDDRR